MTPASVGKPQLGVDEEKHREIERERQRADYGIARELRHDAGGAQRARQGSDKVHLRHPAVTNPVRTLTDGHAAGLTRRGTWRTLFKASSPLEVPASWYSASSFTFHTS